MENPNEQINITPKNPWQEFEEKSKEINSKLQEIKNFLGNRVIQNARKERFFTDKLVQKITDKTKSLESSLEYNQQKVEKGELSKFDLQLAERDVLRFKESLSYYQKILQKIEAKKTAGANELPQIVEETKKSKKLNHHLWKMSKKLINFEKLEKNNYKQELITQGKIKEKLQGIWGIQKIGEFEVDFYKQQIKKATLILTKTQKPEEKNNLPLDIDHYKHLSSKKITEFSNLLTNLNTLKTEGKIDNNINIINRDNFTTLDNQLVIKARNILNNFNNYCDENLKSKQASKENVEKDLGHPLEKSQVEKLRNLAEYRYKNSSYQKRVVEIGKKLEKLKTNLNVLKNPSEEQSSLENKQKELHKYLTEKEYLLNKPVYNPQDGQLIDELELHIIELRKEIKKENDELTKKKVKTLKTIREEIFNKLEKIERELLSAQNGQKTIKAIYNSAYQLLSPQNKINSIYDLHRKTQEDAFLAGKILEIIDEIVNPEAKNDEPERPKKKDSKDENKEEQKEGERKQGDNRNRGGDSGKKRGGKNRGKGRGGNRGRR